MKDATATMGEVLPDDVGGRDAVHVAVISVIADVLMKPGTRVGITRVNTFGEYRANPAIEPLVGIVDPFLKAPVNREERFWLYLNPRTITGLNHQWTHPAFDNTQGRYVTPAQKLDSEKWLREFAATSDCPSYESLMEAATGIIPEADPMDPDTRGDLSYDNDGEYLHFSGRDAHGRIPPEFWDHVEIVTGMSIPQSKRASYFSCSC